AAHVDQLDEAYALLDHAARDQALPAEARRAAALQAVELQRLVGFLAQVEHLRHRHLHAEGGLVALDARFEHRVAGVGALMLAIEAIEQAQLELLHRGRWRTHVEVGYRLRPADDARARIHAGQEVARPDLAAAVRHLWCEYDVARQVLILGAEPVSHPASNARSLEGHAARMDAERRLEVIVVIAAHGADDAEIVGAL